MESVYISSTYKDLISFRRRVIDCIISLNQFYRPVSMEYYDAEDVHFVQKCLDDVAACDVYILILGNRYGYKPIGYDKTITELEYEKALQCQREGRLETILVFKVGDLCDAYDYKETNPQLIEYQGAFLKTVTERLSPKPFESEAELALHVTNALVKRLFKLIKGGEKIIAPDKDVVLCYCDRTGHIRQLQTSVSSKTEKKNIFFIQGRRRSDYPAGIAKRFARYLLGSHNKIEPFIKITDLITSHEPDNNDSSALAGILMHINSPVSDETCTFDGLLAELFLLRSRKVLLPFYYDFDFEEDSFKFGAFLAFVDRFYQVYAAKKPAFELYLLVFIYSERPDNQAVTALLGQFASLGKVSVCLNRLSKVADNDIMDWMEDFITTSEYSPYLYEAYFDKEQDKYDMQDVNLKLTKLLNDMARGDETITQFLA